MAIRKPNLSVTEARRLANVRSAASDQLTEPADDGAVPRRPSAAVAMPPATPAPAARKHSPSAAPSSWPTTLPTAKSSATQATARTLAGNASPAREAQPSASAADLRSPISRSDSPAGKTVPHGSTQAKELPQRREAPHLPHAFSVSKKVQVFVSARLPAPGVSSVFEMLCRQHPPDKALQMILRRALLDYEQMLERGAFQKAAATYPPDESAAAGSFVQTSRMMPRSLAAIARAHFDPLGLESTRAFGCKLATAALAAFFARELK